ncbi:hypothetical protein [Paraburkholderia sp. SIMBA_027]|uniref:hypothetical protein n=1 Tax=Paraburkholderia sp. SIMBA_027 TaxID=3085770 RepID=UPI00397AB098
MAIRVKISGGFTVNGKSLDEPCPKCGYKILPREMYSVPGMTPDEIKRCFNCGYVERAE